MPRAMGRNQTSERKAMAKKRARKRRVWNKGLEVGKRDGFTPDQVKRIRGLLADRGVPGLRDLALFSTAIDTMLHGQDLLPLVVGDVQRRDGSIRPVIEVARARGMPAVRCALSKASTKALEKWITASGKKRADYLFHGRGAKGRHPMGQRQLNRLLKLWVVAAGLDPSDYSVESLRRTKALHILKGTGDLQTVRALLGHARIESTARYLGLETNADPIEVRRAARENSINCRPIPKPWCAGRVDPQPSSPDFAAIANAPARSIRATSLALSSMCATPRQPQLFGCCLQGFVARPQSGAGCQADRDEQVRADVSDASPVKLFALDELKYLNVRGNARLRQLLEITENDISTA